MKKTLMVLTFALCATFVFAQSATPRVKGLVKASKTEASIQNDYSSSIFTKDGPILRTVDFSAPNTGYSTGTITGGIEGHGQPNDYATWQRWTADQTSLTAASATYPYITQAWGGAEAFSNNIITMADTAHTTAENGFMLMMVLEQRTMASGNFNAYIRIDSIDVSAANVIDVRFFQRYRKYYDHNYIDYCTDGVNWNEVEINVTGIDVDVNGDLAGFRSYSLPVAAASGNYVDIRIRWKSLGDRGNTYGYWWLIDDVTVVTGDDDRMKMFGEEYVEGNYGMIPQGMQVNPAWIGKVQNNGYNAQNNVIATIHHLNAAQDVETEIDMFNNQTIPADQYTRVYVDRAGWLLPDSLDYAGWYGYIDHTPNGTGVDLPTSTLGDNYMYATVGNSAVNLTFDTMYYRVTGNENGVYRWGHDNGVLVYLPSNIWTFGYIQSGDSWYVTDDPEEVKFYKAGYTVTTRYTTDANVPEGWVIRGVELVASPVKGYHSTGSRISSVLQYDEYDGGSVGFRSILTGANVKEITEQDVNDSTIIGRDVAGYLEPGNYHTVVINFPEQPALEPNTTYRVGYSMEEDSYFGVAQESHGYYRIASPSRPDRFDTIIYFRNNESTAKYGSYFPMSQYQNYFNDPSYGGTGQSSTFASWYYEYNPMIRILVGPAQAVNRVNINVECDSTDFGTVAYGGNEVCGQTITPVEGSTATLVASTATWCTVKSVLVDGVEVQPWNEDTEEGDPNLIAEYDNQSHIWVYQYRFVDVQSEHTIKFVFAEGQPISIDPAAAGVRMNLQPNPATSMVNLNIEGVTGMVNCMLIDMSGRVVYNQSINAEANQTINVSNLAKGAYFVRITNDNFTKVEKLIVR